MTFHYSQCCGRRKVDYSFHYLKYAILLSQLWKTTWSNEVDAGPNNSHSMEKPFNLKNKVTI